MGYKGEGGQRRTPGGTGGRDKRAAQPGRREKRINRSEDKRADSCVADT